MSEKSCHEEPVKRSAKTVLNGGSKHAHPSHEAHLMRLRRVRGQIDGIERMILERRYCPDIINQLKASGSALKAIEAEIFKTHIRGCVQAALKSKNSIDSETKIEEILKMIY